MTKLKIANIGAKWFYENLVTQKGVEVRHINWSPKGKSKKVYHLLDKLQQNKVLQKNIEQANSDVVRKISSSTPFFGRRRKKTKRIRQ